MPPPLIRGPRARGRSPSAAGRLGCRTDTGVRTRAAGRIRREDGRSQARGTGLGSGGGCSYLLLMPLPPAPLSVPGMTNQVIRNSFGADLARDDDYFRHLIADGAPTAYEAPRAVVHGGPFTDGKDHAFRYGCARRSRRWPHRPCSRQDCAATPLFNRVVGGKRAGTWVSALHSVARDHAHADRIRARGNK